MSIATEMSALAANKAAIKAAIESKSPAIAPTDALAQWPTAIASIPSGGGGGGSTYDVIVVGHTYGEWSLPGNAWPITDGTRTFTGLGPDHSAAEDDGIYLELTGDEYVYLSMYDLGNLMQRLVSWDIETGEATVLDSDLRFGPEKSPSPPPLVRCEYELHPYRRNHSFVVTGDENFNLRIDTSNVQANNTIDLLWVVDCTDIASSSFLPTIFWGNDSQAFHPVNDDASNLVLEEGKVCIFSICEVLSDTAVYGARHFLVSRQTLGLGEISAGSSGSSSSAPSSSY